MARLGLETDVVDDQVYRNTVEAFRSAGIVLPTFEQLATPPSSSSIELNTLSGVDPDAADARNLRRVNWYNGPDRRSSVSTPQYVELPAELTGVRARIVLLLGDSFPMIRAHKVLAAYSCLAPRLVTGQFDPRVHRAVWPSTGNYCRGGVAISRIMGCRGMAVLPEGMSRERFEWLDEWVVSPEEIVRTPGTESNVKEIYDKCAELDASPNNIIFNQFSEFGNYLGHFFCTGRALERVFESMLEKDADLQLAGYLSATGSAGTLGAGDYLKERHGTKIVAVEALECPTLLSNGFGEHNIQGIGDKHVPLIHNVMNTDFVTAVSDHSTDELYVLFNSDVGRRFLATRKGVSQSDIESLGHLGLSSICNLLAAVKLAKRLDLDESQVLMTIATDGAEMYGSENAKFMTRDFPNGFDELAAAETFGQHLAGTATDNLLELSHTDRERIFNLGYFTWVEQQGVSLADFAARKNQRFWRELRTLVPTWDAMIDQFNRETGLS
jgi:cysteine synthase A